MGFAFLFLFIVFIIVPSTLILLVVSLITKKKIFAQAIGCLWIPIVFLLLFVFVIGIFTKKMTVEKDDMYGEYVIDRTKFPGAQADWQYNHYRFKISRENRFVFYVTDGEKIRKTYTGTVRLNEAYISPRMKLHFDDPHHIIADNPTLYRDVWSFYYVFNSAKFGNVFFTKGEWEPIDD